MSHQPWLLSTTVGRVWPLPALAAIVGIFPVILVGLAAPMALVGPLAVALGGLFAGVAASWVANYSAIDGSRSRILPIVGATEAVTVAIAAVLAGLLLLNAPLPLIAVIALGGAGIGWVASWAAWRMRTTPTRRGFDLVLSLSLVVLGLLIVITTIPLVCSSATTCRA